ncbi:putative capsid protein [Odonata-associated circular virus-1]|uniref:putative capsid protein n=1 Tax=Odonata-associated circular virus-1 TaxID=1592109 RepID=UPI0005860407|nr:putative capsid protein [Odonata-associated circular virus-1]AJD07476.1 putative capsid protein [Odonata-associated circular virus-1]
MVKLVRRRRVLRKRKSVPKRRMMRRGVGRASVKRTSDYAKCVEIQETKMTAVNDATLDSVGGVINFCLQDFQRPQEIAHAYKYYRAAKCEITFIPYFNIAQTANAAATQLPQLYMTVDRLSNRWIAPTESEMLSRGVSPRLFTKKMRLSFKPNLLQGISLETQQSVNYPSGSPPGGNPAGISNLGYQKAIAVFNKGLPTQQSYGYSNNSTTGALQAGQVLAPLGVNPYDIRYHGAAFVPAIEVLAANTPVAVGDIQVKITWESKRPRALMTNSPLNELIPYVSSCCQGNTNAVLNTQPTSYPSGAIGAAMTVL